MGGIQCSSGRFDFLNTRQTKSLRWTLSTSHNAYVLQSTSDNRIYTTDIQKVRYENLLIQRANYSENKILCTCYQHYYATFYFVTIESDSFVPLMLECIIYRLVEHGVKRLETITTASSRWNCFQNKRCLRGQNRWLSEEFKAKLCARWAKTLQPYQPTRWNSFGTRRNDSSRFHGPSTSEDWLLQFYQELHCPLQYLSTVWR